MCDKNMRDNVITKEEFNRRCGSLKAVYDYIKKSGGIGIAVREKFHVDLESDGLVSDIYNGSSHKYKLYGPYDTIDIVNDKIKIGLRDFILTANVIRETRMGVIRSEVFEIL